MTVFAVSTPKGSGFIVKSGESTAYVHAGVTGCTCRQGSRCGKCMGLRA